MSETKEKRKMSKPPWWGWLFVIGCAAIPIITLGGAIPGMIGGGGGAACYQLAGNAEKSLQTRFLGCMAILVLCWALFGGFIYVYQHYFT